MYKRDMLVSQNRLCFVFFSKKNTIINLFLGENSNFLDAILCLHQFHKDTHNINSLVFKCFNYNTKVKRWCISLLRLPYWSTLTERQGNKQQKFVFSQFWCLEIWDEGIWVLISPRASHLGMWMTHLFPVSSHVFSLYVFTF